MDNALELRAWADNDSDAERAVMMRLAAAEIDRLRASVDRKQEQYERSQRYWVDASRKALAGDTEHLRLRVDLALSGPIELSESTN